MNQKAYNWTKPNKPVTELGPVREKFRVKPKLVLCEPICQKQIQRRRACQRFKQRFGGSTPPQMLRGSPDSPSTRPNVYASSFWSPPVVFVIGFESYCWCFWKRCFWIWKMVFRNFGLVSGRGGVWKWKCFQFVSWVSENPQPSCWCQD